MPYLRRDEKGKICAIVMEGRGEGLEPATLSNAEVMAFLLDQPRARGIPEGCDLHKPQCMEVIVGLNEHKREMTESDLDLVRVLDDLVDVLVGKGLLMFSELPPDAQRKLRARQRMRSDGRDNTLMVGGDDIL